MDTSIKQAHLHVIDVDTKAARQVTRGNFSVTNFSWAPDGQSFALTRSPTPRVPDNYNSEIYTVPLSGGEPRPLVVRPGVDSSPKFSPDGKWVAFATGKGTIDWAGENPIAVVPAAGGEPRVITGEYDRTPTGFAWAADSKSLYFNGPYNTTAQLYRVGIDGIGWKDLSRVQGVIGDADFDVRHNRTVFVYQTLVSPPELHISEIDSFKPQQLTEENSSLKTKQLGETRLIQWKNPKDGLAIEGLLSLPPGYKEGQRYPLLTFAHGGPSSFFDQQYLGYLSYCYPTHVFAAKGFAVLRPNPRGSGAYGQKFRAANRADWGGMDYVDIQSGIDSLVEKGIADPAQLGFMGWSYGGFMSSWTITQTDRFKAVSIGAPVTDLFSFQGTSDIPGFIPSYFGALPYNAYDLYRAHNPMSHISHVKTPALIQQGEADVRVPPSQAEVLYQALLDLKIPVLMVTYPRTPHTPQEPNLRRDVCRRNVWWFEKWFHGVDKTHEEYWTSGLQHDQ